MLSQLDMSKAREVYLVRKETHQAIIKSFESEDVRTYLELALGIANEGAGNYSAAEHNLGWRILDENPPQSIFAFAKDLYDCAFPKAVPNIIRRHNLKYLKISVGSEMAMMLQPNDFWVANVRTVWAHLLIKHADNYAKANEELQLYRDGDRTSEMDYQIWSDIYRTLETALVRLHDLGTEEAKRQGVEPGQLKYLWADAIADLLYLRRQTK